jgi:hypothetical protein
MKIEKPTHPSPIVVRPGLLVVRPFFSTASSRSTIFCRAPALSLPSAQSLRATHQSMKASMEDSKPWMS